MRWIFPALLLACSAASAQSQLPPGPGRNALLKVCSACHDPENVVGMGKSKDDWASLVSDMAMQGAQGTDDEFNQIVDYLAANFPDKVNVNKAPARLLASVLDLSDKQAGAIVQYRQDNGSFKTIADLTKVPGIDAKKIEDRKAFIVF